MPVLPYEGILPKIAEDVFIAKGAVVIGDVTIGSGGSVWYNTVVRGDIASIAIGRNCNLQDNTTVHVDRGKPVTIGDDVSVGHGAVVHGCTVGRGALIGIHAVVLSGATIGEDCIVGAGAVVPEGKDLPARSLALGVPARVIRSVTDEEVAQNTRRVQRYAQLAQDHKRAAGS